MARTLKRLEAPEMHKAIITNAGERTDPNFQLLLWPDGGLIIQTKVGEVIDLTPEQTAALYSFFDGQRVKTRMLDVLRRQVYKIGPIGRKLIKAIDKEFSQPTA